VLVLGVIAPFISASRFRGAIQGALESSLGRKVEFERVSFTLFSGPGFTLEKVAISEDPRYGIEPFAYVPVVQARLRLDKILRGQVRFAGLSLESPSLNLVKNADGTWNVVTLMQRLSAPTRLPLNLFPSLEISDGRVDFKFGVRKATLYISESDLSIYPEQSGKLYMSFSGSPARTDRAGIGFGHFRGSINWFLNAADARSKQLEAEIQLDPSNLSELTTLVEGHDVGVHGTISSRLQVAGPLNDLRVGGELHLNDVHRWDLLPASGEEWTVRYGGKLDLRGHQVDLRTLPQTGSQASPVAIRLRVTDFLAKARSSVVAELKGAPLQDLLPLAIRMGLSLPSGATVSASTNGAIGYSTDGGWAGGLQFSEGKATLAGAPELRAANTQVTINGDHIHFDPSVLEAGSGLLKLSGDYYVSDQRASALLDATNVAIRDFKPLVNSWLGGIGPLSSIRDGIVSGQFAYLHRAAQADAADDQPAASWSGQLGLSGASIAVPGLSLPLAEAHGRASFTDAAFEFDRLSGIFGGLPIRVSYRYNPALKHTERARLEFSQADLGRLEQFLASADEPRSLWARLRFGRQPVLNWLGKRSLEGDLVIHQLSAGDHPLGTFDAHFLCTGRGIEFSGVSLKLLKGKVRGNGSVDLTDSDPHWRFSATATGYPWSGGSLSAEGEIEASGVGKDLLRSLSATGSFAGEDLAFASDHVFGNATGLFRLSFSEGWPDLRLSNVQAVQEGDEWTGEALTQSDGKLLVNLEHDGRQLHFVGSLNADKPAAPPSVLPQAGDVTRTSRAGLKF